MFLSPWALYFFSSVFLYWERVKMSGPCTNCTDLTLGRQQHAFFHVITFHYTPWHISAKEGDRKHGARLVPWLSESVAWPCFILSGCVHHLLLLLSRFNDGFVLNGAAALVVASSSLRARVQLIMQMRGARAWMNENPFWESPPPPISYQTGWLTAKQRDWGFTCCSTHPFLKG